MNKIKITAITILILFCVAAYFFTSRTVVRKVSDPTGKYTAITSVKNYLYFVPMSPGSSGDKPCFVKIIDNKGNNYGEIPVAMLQLVDINWIKNGAYIKFAGNWNFKDKTCYYWSKEDDKIFVKIR